MDIAAIWVNFKFQNRYCGNMPENTSNNIKKLLEDITNDGEIAFREIFNYYKIPFHAIALRTTRSEAVAEGIVQELFVTIFVKIK